MRPKRVLTIMGTRPEVIKLSPILSELERRPRQFCSRICTTGQHGSLLRQQLKYFGVEPHHDLAIITKDQSLSRVTARAIEGLDRILRVEAPDLVLVQGDTTTAVCGALAAYYHRTQIGHVEAGLRSGDKYAPFPEESNRRMITQLADYHFAPTPRARLALVTEGVQSASVFVTGNTGIDALLWTRARVQQPPQSLPPELVEEPSGPRMVLVTAHRRESFGEAFADICAAISEVADAFRDVVFVYPVHLNPKVQEPVKRLLGAHPRIKLLDPLPYPDFIWVMDHAIIVLTDSGGVQEEAPSLGKPVLVMRETTERPEGIEAGNARLVGVRRQGIAKALTFLLEHPEERKSMAKVRNPYGDGKAAKSIVNILEQLLSRQGVGRCKSHALGI